MAFLRHDLFTTITFLRYDIFETWSVCDNNLFETWHFRDMTFLRQELFEAWPFWDMIFLRQDTANDFIKIFQQPAVLNGGTKILYFALPFHYPVLRTRSDSNETYIKRFPPKNCFQKCCSLYGEMRRKYANFCEC